MDTMMKVRALLVSAVMVLGMGVVMAPSASAVDPLVCNATQLRITEANVKMVQAPYNWSPVQTDVTVQNYQTVTPACTVTASAVMARLFRSEDGAYRDVNLGKAAVFPDGRALWRANPSQTYLGSGTWRIRYVMMTGAGMYVGAYPATTSTVTLKNPVSVLNQSAKNDPGKVVPAGTTLPLYATYEYPLAPKTTVPILLQTRPNANADWETVESLNGNAPEPGEIIFMYRADSSVQYRFVTPDSGYVTGVVSGELALTTTGNPTPPPPPVTQVPAAPAAVISNIAETTISIDWTTSAPDVTAYQFGWTTPSGKPRYAWQLDYPVGDPRLKDPFVLTNLEPGATYNMWVAARNAAGLSARTELVATTKGGTPPPPEPPVVPPLPPVTPPVVPPVVGPPAPPAPPVPPVVTPPAPPTAPAKAVTVRVKSKSKASKLYVNVNPNLKKSRYWRFQVQKLVGDTWVAKKTYKTYGKGETRTLNFKKGTYRVVVLPKYGYQGATSAAVYLRK